MSYLKKVTLHSGNATTDFSNINQITIAVHLNIATANGDVTIVTGSHNFTRTPSSSVPSPDNQQQVHAVVKLRSIEVEQPHPAQSQIIGKVVEPEGSKAFLYRTVPKKHRRRAEWRD